VLVGVVLGRRRRPNRRCLITGFNDWRNLSNIQDIWVSDENPSSRLILGQSSREPSIIRRGDLVQVLKKINIAVDWSFATLPTLWRTSRSLDLAYYDIVIHLGLGVYDNKRTILVECGAYNERCSSPDASGSMSPSSTICTGGPAVLVAPLRVASAVVSAADLELSGGFRVELAPARQSNTYICNETHYRALEAVHLAECCPGTRLRAAYFVHIPYPDEPDNYGALADAVGAVIVRLVEKST
jgi:pyrrolidone-carboxylate peptidase